MSRAGKGIVRLFWPKFFWYGYKTTCVKIDLYVNVDASTMNSLEHGEVNVISATDEK